MRSAAVVWLDGEIDMKIPNGHAVRQTVGLEPLGILERSWLTIWRYALASQAPNIPATVMP